MINKVNDSEQLVLVINSGSSSIKYTVFSFPAQSVVLHGDVNEIGTNQSSHHIHLKVIGSEDIVIEQDSEVFYTHRDGFNSILEALFRFDETMGDLPIAVIAHRVVHGGDQFISPTVINEDVLERLDDLIHLAPLHNPDNIQGARICHQAFPDIPQVAVFDTAFHQTMPDYAYRYAIPDSWYQQYKIRRYGFHGSSHQYVATQAAQLLGRPLTELNFISLHLGNGASACAIQQGKSIDTSMGFTPLEGLIMGGRSGDLDASIALYMQQNSAMTNEQIEHALNEESGLYALAGSNNMTDLLAQEKIGDVSARLALEAYVYRIRKYIGAYLLILGHVDAIIFTAGVGENSPEIRARCCENLETFGIELETKLNEQQIEQSALMNVSSSHTKIIVIRTNEELQIAYEARKKILS